MVLLAGTLVALARPVAADQYTDQISADQHQKQSIDQQIANLKAEIANAKDQEAKLQSVIAGLDAQISTTEGQIGAAKAQLAVIESNLAAAQAQLDEAKAQLAAEKRQLAKQIVVIYEMQQQSTPINNLLASGSFNSFWADVINGRRISDQELATVDEIHHQQDVIQSDVDAITAQRQQQQAMLGQLAAEQQQLDSQRAVQQAALAFLAYIQAQDQAREQQMQAAAAALDSQIAQLQQEEQLALAAGGGDGRFVWPDSGPISQGFGCTPFAFEPYDPSCPSKHFHSGIDIAGACGNSIYAADSGIAYIEPYQSYGYGNYIIMVHGNGWETLYGHMSGFAVGSGQTVHRGQQIGWEGSTGNSTGCHLHFGVNHNNQWVNPLAYLP
ncbi:MAG: peptidoglycan DD-metalloendopeptidase family protein [Candidatus Dormibacteraeota bacterium]|nr:peptidoglycan DD-metalloendopeptidase family protein [Candidatus Dormibacteraeota bacterium]